MAKISPFQVQEQLAQAQRLHRAGEVGPAYEIYKRLQKQAPSDPRLLYFVGTAALSLGRTDEARTCLANAVKLAPGDVAAWHDLALTHKRDGRFDDALAAIDRGLALRPDDPTLWATKSGIHQMMGDYPRAAQALEGPLQSAPDHIAVVLALARIAPRLRRHDEAIQRIGAVLDSQPSMAPTLRADLLFNLGAILDSAARYDDAFHAFSQAHNLRSARFDPDAFSREIDASIANWTRPAFDRLPRGRTRSERPIFIVGMPRSGTSLVEQILASHPQVFGGGELDDISAAVFSLSGRQPSGIAHLTDPGRLTASFITGAERAYLDRLNRLGPAAARITDKMPTNFLHLGLIATLFPKARILHCIRDPRDTCLSCYVQNFGGAHPYTHDLSHLGRFCRDYQRLMAHWAATLPISILDVVYEDLVADLEPAARRMVEFLGLSWEPQCLQFHQSSRIVRTSSNDQVRRPIYTASIGRWKNYLPHVQPLLDALGPLPPRYA